MLYDPITINRLTLKSRLVMPPMQTGRFISFEGPEGGGKSTQAKRLAERLGGGIKIQNTVRHDITSLPYAP